MIHKLLPINTALSHPEFHFSVHYRVQSQYFDRFKVTCSNCCYVYHIIDGSEVFIYNFIYIYSFDINLHSPPCRSSWAARTTATDIPSDHIVHLTCLRITLLSFFFSFFFYFKRKQGNFTMSLQMQMSISSHL